MIHLPHWNIKKTDGIIKLFVGGLTEKRTPSECRECHLCTSLLESPSPVKTSHMQNEHLGTVG